MDKLLPLLALIVTASISVGPSAAGESRFAGPPSHPFATDAAEGDAAVVLVGGMGGGATTGGMGGGATTGGMGSGAPTGSMFGGGMFNNPPPSFGTNSGSGWPGDNAQPSYYTYQCVTSSGQCSFVAPASLRASSLRVGARCSCSDGQSQGQVR